MTGAAIRLVTLECPPGLPYCCRPRRASWPPAGTLLAESVSHSAPAAPRPYPTRGGGGGLPGRQVTDDRLHSICGKRRWTAVAHFGRRLVTWTNRTCQTGPMFLSAAAAVLLALLRCCGHGTLWSKTLIFPKQMIASKIKAPIPSLGPAAVPEAYPIPFTAGGRNTYTDSNTNTNTNTHTHAHAHTH